MCRTKRITKMLACLLFPLLSGVLAAPALAAGSDNMPQAVLAQKVSHQLATLQYYGVFDHLTFRILAPRTIVLAGQVTRPGLRSDAETAVEKVSSSIRIVNDIEVLPNSAVDDSIRWEAFKAIFEKPSLQQYAIQTVSPLRIIVENREITLEGTVSSKYDKTLIDMSARSVTEAAGVSDNLMVR